CGGIPARLGNPGRGMAQHDDATVPGPPLNVGQGPPIRQGHGALNHRDGHGCIVTEVAPQARRTRWSKLPSRGGPATDTWSALSALAYGTSTPPRSATRRQTHPVGGSPSRSG